MAEQATDKPVLGSGPRSDKSDLVRHHDAPPEPDPGLDAAKKIAAGAIPLPEDGKEIELDPEQTKLAEDAGEWLLASFDHHPDTHYTLDLNVGTPSKKKWIAWTIKAIPGDRLREIRAKAAERSEANMGRRQGSGGVLTAAQAAYRASLEIVVEGTVEPNLHELAAARGLADSAMIVEGAFSNKQGLVETVAAEISALSGYDNDDIRDHLEQGVSAFS
jgi:hypothetical protein